MRTRIRELFKSAVSLKAVIYRAKRITLMIIQTSMAKMTGVLLGLGFDVVLNRRYPSVQYLSLARWAYENGDSKRIREIRLFLLVEFQACALKSTSQASCRAWVFDPSFTASLCRTAWRVT